MFQKQKNIKYLEMGRNKLNNNNNDDADNRSHKQPIIKTVSMSINWIKSYNDMKETLMFILQMRKLKPEVR